MSIILFANNAATTLAGPISNTSVAANLAAGSGALFPNPAAGQHFVMTFQAASNPVNNEIVWVTSVTGDTITMLRGQEGTSAQSWNAGDLAAIFWTAGQATAMLQSTSLPDIPALIQAQAGNYAADTGTANAYTATLNPAPASLFAGLTLRIKITHANTGASTLNVNGLGAKSIVNPDGTALVAGQLPAGIAMFVYDGTNHQLISAATNATGRLLRTSIYDNLSGTLRVSIDGGAFANAGSSAFTPLATTTQVEFELQGGGGGGGGALITGPSQVSVGAGGAAGGWLHKRVPVATVTGQAITVGAAGVSAAGLAGTSGGSTSIGAVASATGGNGGTLGVVAAITGSPAGGSNGGTASGGDINGAGQSGTYAFYTNPPVSGFGGGSAYGAGAGGVTGTAGGNASQSYGAGGGGGSLIPSAGTNATGGNGKCGLAIFREYA